MRARSRLRPGRSLRIALPLLLAGCALGPRYERPALEIPAAYRATPASAAQAWPAAEWWRGFRSPELDALIAEARAHNNDLLAAIARVRQADAQVRIAGAPLLPTVDANASGAYERVGIKSRTSSGSFASAFTQSTGSHYTDIRQYSLDAGISYELDFWGRNRATAQAAEASALASRFDQETVALTVVSSVATTWFQALAFADRLAVAERNLRDARDSLNVIRARLAAGTATALDLAQQETQVAQEEAVIPNLKSQMEQELIALGILVGRPPEQIAARPGTLFALATPEASPGLPADILARRPDIANAEALLVSQNANIRAARAAFFPSVTLTGSAGWSSAVLASLISPGSALTSVTGSLTQTIFDNGLRRGELEQAKGRYEELVAGYRQAVLQAFTDVDTAVTATRYATEQEGRARRAVATAQRASDIARAQLAAGTVDVTTVLNTETNLFTAQDTLAQVRLARFQALVNLYKALGGGWTLPPTDAGST